MIARLVLAAVVVGALTACDFFGTGDAQLTTAPQGFESTGGSGGFNAAVVGVWSHTDVSSDGVTQAGTQTIWTFRDDGTATLTVITTSDTPGFSSQQTSSALWTTTGATLLVSFQPPSSGSQSFSFAVSDSRLTLNGVDFSRIG